eukprot:13580396-Alexandrium_andersonii.AAC.1
MAGMHSIAGSNRLCELMMLALPSRPGEHDVKAASAALQHLKAGPLYNFIAPEHQAKFNLGAEVVKAVASERLPSVQVALQDPALRPLVDSLAWFVSFSAAG